MFSLVCGRVIKGVKCKYHLSNSITHVGHVESNPRAVIIRCFSLLSNKGSKVEDEHSFAVSYLINSCGLSLENAQVAIASKKMNFQTPERPDSVLALLRNQGFTDAHISKLVKNYPPVLLASPEKILLPKLEFCRSIGISSVNIGNIVSRRPELLMQSLSNNIIPCYEHLKSITGNEKSAATAFKLSLRIPKQRMLQNLTQNIPVLRNLGVSQSNISLLVTHHPWVACVDHDKFNRLIAEVKDLGFDPSKCAFVKGMKVIYGIGTQGLERKIEVYGTFGWSKEEGMSAFRCEPCCMSLSEKRIIKTMDFLVNKMGWPSKLFAKHPGVLCLNLEKRIIPRCFVAQVLVSSGLLKKKLSINSLLKASEKDFFPKFVTKYQESIPQLMDVYERKKDSCDLAVHSEKI